MNARLEPSSLRKLFLGALLATALCPSTAEASALPAEEAVTSHNASRLRYGAAGGLGVIVEGSNAHLYGGSDLHVGLQLNRRWAFYGQGHFGGFGGSARSLLSPGSLTGGSILAEATFHDRLFLGLGGGYAGLTEAGMPELLLKLGGYPLVFHHESWARRCGFAVGVDLRGFLIEEQVVFAPTVNVGWVNF